MAMIEQGVSSTRPPETVFGEYRGIRYMISRRSWFCAYIEVPATVSEEDITCHEGVTYGYDGIERYYPVVKEGAAEGNRVFGWDYAHMGDEHTTEEDVIMDIRTTIDIYLDGGTSE